MDLNKAMIIGRLTRDPELRNIPSGVSVANFVVASNRVYTDQAGNKQETVEFHNIVVWRRLAEICAQYLTKGRRVYLEGRLQTRSWDDPNGFKRYRTEIVADNMIILDAPRGRAPVSEASTSAVATPTAPAAPYSAAEPAGRPEAVQQPSPTSSPQPPKPAVPPEEDIPTIDISEEVSKTDTDSEENEEAEVSVEDIPF